MMQCSDILQLCIRHLYHSQERTEHLTLVVLMMLMLVVVAAAAEILKMMVTMMMMKLTFFL